MGFFFSANEIWESQITNRSRTPSAPASMFSLLSQTLTGRELFRPLMRVKQRISTFFHKRVKTEEETLQHRANFSKFKQSLEDEIEQKMRALTLQEKEEPKEPEVVFEKIPDVNPINQNLLQSAYSYIQGIISKDKWQVARGFVTNILEINYNKIAEALAGKDEPRAEISVRVLKPASDFYHNLMVVWLLFRGSDYRIKFKEYLERVKSTLGTAWREQYPPPLPSYIEPTKIFFSNLNSQWTKLTCETETLHREDDEVRRP